MFNKNLKKYREFKNLTQFELALKISSILGKTFSTENIKSYEASTNPKIEVIEALAHALDVPVQFLFNDSKEETFKAISIMEENEEFYNYKSKNKNLISVTDAYSNDTVKIDKRLIVDTDEKLFYLKIISHALYPTFKKNDIILFRKIDEDEILDDDYFVVSIDGTFKVRKVIFLEDGGFIVKSNDYQETFKKRTMIVGGIVARICY